MPRHPNTVCVVCHAPLYRRPSTLAKTCASYCSEDCRLSDASPQGKRRVSEQTCERQGCRRIFKPNKRGVRFCSKSCANTARYGMTYQGLGWRSANERRRRMLVEAFDLHACMVEGCRYSKCYDIHRHIPGRQGGQYEIGNMFAICPNHHAEVTRGLITLQKVDDHTLRIDAGVDERARLESV